MQTFLPDPDYSKSAYYLDRQRLGKQRVECLQILNTLTFGSRWENHPAVRMWKGFELGLIQYGLAICREWIKRGYKDTCSAKIEGFLEYYDAISNPVPQFIGDELFHSSHRSALLFKKPEWYSKFGWKESPAVPDIKGSLPYVWPI